MTAVMLHTNATAAELAQRLVELEYRRADLASSHGDDLVVLGKSGKIDNSRELRTASGEISHIEYEIGARKARDASPFEFGQRVEILPAWTMDDPEHRDWCTGARGRVSGWSYAWDGEPAEIHVETKHHGLVTLIEERVRAVNASDGAPSAPL